MVNKLSKTEIAAYKEAFRMLDRDHDGRLTAKELGSVLRSLGQHAAESDLRDFINEVDIDGNGTLEVDEFLEMMSKRQWEVNHLEEIMDVFKVLDKNGDGFINAAELRHIMSKLGVKISDQEAQDMINEADEDGDGKLNNVEFVRIMMKT